MLDTSTQNHECILYGRFGLMYRPIGGMTFNGDISFMEQNIGRKLSDISPGYTPEQYQDFYFKSIVRTEINITYLIFDYEPIKPIPPTS